jgi:IclR family transcriptional regulator, acetate operon repressor
MTVIRSAVRVSRILAHVAEQPGGSSAKELAAALDLSLPTAYHLLGTLVAEGLLAKDGQRRYRLGPMAGRIADAYARQFAPPEHLVQPLHRLAAATSETAYLATWRAGRVAVLASVEGQNAVRVSGVRLGFADAAHARASGKALLAFAPEAARRTYLVANPLVAVTPRTIVDPHEFELELERIRLRGYAVDEEEFREGVACAAAPLLDGGRAVAAFSISAPTERFRQNRDELVAQVIAAGEEAAVAANGSLTALSRS